MLADPTKRDLAVSELARTYDTPRYADPWDAVQDYRRVQRYCAEHPDQKSQAVSTALDLPRERIRGWVDSDVRPDCVHAIDTAERRSWLVDSWEPPVAQGLNVLAAWLLSSGSIASDPLRPRWLDDGRPDELRAAAEKANLTLVRRPTDDDRPDEWVPREDEVVLGRLLHLWTGLRGDKAPERTRFPRYPALAPIPIARAFARTYVRNRAVGREDTADRRVQIMEDRSDQYRQDLVGLLERVATAPDLIRGDSWPIYIVDEAIDDFVHD